MSFNLAPFQTHLKELRHRLIVCFSSIAVAFVICYIFSKPIISLLFYPVIQALPSDTSLVFTALPEGFMAHLKVAFWSGIILSTPVILYQIWAFVAPGLYSHEKRVARKFLFWGIGLFIAGALFGYWGVMPVVLSITLGFVSQGLEAMPRLQNYLLFVLKTLFTFGIIFEIPFLMAIAGKTGLVSRGYFKKNRKFAYILLYLLSVILVPTDLFSQALLFLPLAAMYEIGSRLSEWLTSPKKEKEK